MRLYSFEFFNSGRKGGHHFECITYNSIVCGFKERCFRIFIDDHDHFAAIDTGQVLYGSGDADGHIKGGGNSDSGLANVFIVRAPVCIGHGSTTSSGSSHHLCQFFDYAPILGTLKASSSTDHCFCFGKQ